MTFAIGNTHHLIQPIFKSDKPAVKCTKALLAFHQAIKESSLDTATAQKLTDFIEDLTPYLSATKIHCQLCRHIYPLYEKIMECALFVESLEDSSIQQAWLKVLDSSEGKPVKFDLGKKQALKFRHVRQMHWRGELPELKVDQPKYGRFFDIVELARKLKNLWIKCGGQGLHLEWNAYSRLLNHPNQVVVVAREEESNKVVGFVCGTVLSLPTRLEKVLHISHLGRDPGAAKQGIADRLLKKVQEVAERHWACVAAMTLYTSSNNEPALNLYKKNGFKEKEVIPNFYPIAGDQARFEDGLFLMKSLYKPPAGMDEAWTYKAQEDAFRQHMIGIVGLPAIAEAIQNIDS